MPHGRDHQQRETHVRLTRSGNTPEKDSTEARLLTSGRKRGAPPEGLVGAHKKRRTAAQSADREQEARGAWAGSEVAPTKQAARREQERHRLERAAGRVAAGTKGRRRAQSAPGATREQLDAAARAADRAVKRPKRSGR
jgi:hypothetical protein